ncbi:acetyl-CoA carboxylase biotin carboxylase subunit family protein [Kitasatospora sp. NPDC059463]|uniref:ATP-grasp domain-containing protein n=1 Tax=unclassified Kitasatospora TaxID=2633591 RepID=UPI0036C4A402
MGGVPGAVSGGVSGAQRVLVVEPSPELLRRAARAGFLVWSLADRGRRGGAHLREVAGRSRGLLLVDTGDAPAVRGAVACAVREHGIAHVLNLGGVRTAGPVFAAAQDAGVAVNPAHTVEVLTDRGALRALLSPHPRLRVRARRAYGGAGVERAVAGFGGQAVVVRSARPGGPRRAELLRGQREVGRWRLGQGGGGQEPFVVEEYLPGPQYAVETLSVDGMHQVLGIIALETTGPPHFVTTTHLYPAPLAGRDEAAIRSAVCAVLDLAGFENGAVRTTVVHGPGGTPRVLACRPGLDRADHAARLVRLAGGADLEEAALRALTGEVPAAVPAGRSAVVGLVCGPPGDGAGDGAGGGFDGGGFGAGVLAGVRELPCVAGVEVAGRGVSPGCAAHGHGLVAVVGAGARQALGHLAAARARLAGVGREVT